VDPTYRTLKAARKWLNSKQRSRWRSHGHVDVMSYRVLGSLGSRAYR
jgi:hypothetical protein